MTTDGVGWMDYEWMDYKWMDYKWMHKSAISYKIVNGISTAYR